MQPNPQQPPFPQQGPPPAPGGPALAGSGPGPGAPAPGAAPVQPPRPPRARSNTAAAVTAGVLALLTAGMLVAFAFVNVAYALGPIDRAGPLGANIASGLIFAGLITVAAAFTFFRWISAAWSLCGLSASYAAATIFLAPLMFGTTQLDQLVFLFGFREIDDVTAGLAVILSVLTAVSAAIAGSVKSRGPGTA